MGKNPCAGSNDIQEITAEEYENLLQIMADANPADIDDLELYEAGSHRDLYNYLTKKMGLSVKAGRGPVWHRVKALVAQYEITHQLNMSANDPKGERES